MDNWRKSQQCERHASNRLIGSFQEGGEREKKRSPLYRNDDEGKLWIISEADSFTHRWLASQQGFSHKEEEQQLHCKPQWMQFTRLSGVVYMSGCV